MDQATAQAHLDAWEAADLAIASGKEYSIGNRSLTRVDAEEVRNQLTYWRREVKTAAASAAGQKNPGIVVASWNS